MSRFRRSEHYRTNSQGTTFKVREHGVNRDEWGHSGHRTPAAASAFSATVLSEPGIIYPNARCPECRDRVYFFKASNGGRVFFDTLWPAWDKHPCTISESVSVMDTAPVYTAEIEDPEIGTDAYEIGVHIRPTRTVLSITGDDGARYLSGDLDLSRKYFPHAWVKMEDGRDKGVLTLLGADMKPMEIAVTPAEEPKAITGKQRRELCAGMKSDLIRAAKRVKGLKKSFMQTKPGYDIFVSGVVGNSRVVIIPVPCDQVRWDHDTFDDLGSYLAATASRIIDLLDKTMPRKDDLIEQDHVIFAFRDSFGYVSDGMDGVPYVERDRSMQSDAFGINDSTKLDERFLKNLRWIDLADDDPIVIEPIRANVAMALSKEDRFCEEAWPDEVAGRWRQIETLFARLGLEATFRAAHEILKAAGWGVEYSYYQLQAAQYTPTDETDLTRDPVRVLFHRSSADKGICFLIEPDKDWDPAQDRLVMVRDAADAHSLVKRISRGPLPTWFEA